MGEDDAVMKAASAKDIVLKIWHSKDGPVSDKPPARVRMCLKEFSIKPLVLFHFFKDVKIGPTCSMVIGAFLQKDT